MGDRPRYSHRQSRYYDDDVSDNSGGDDYPPPRPRKSDRAPRPDRVDSVAMPPPPPMPAPQVRRPSILVDPDETPSERDRRRRSHSNSNVRIQASDDDDDYARPPRQSRSAQPPTQQRASRHDAEGKGGDGYEKFRSKRDGYESDEGEKLRRAKKAPRDYDERQERSLPLRGKPRDPIDGVEYGGAPPPPSGGGEVRRRRTYKEPSSRDRQGYDDYDPEPRRPERRRTAAYDDPGYRSEHARRDPPRRAPRPRYDDEDEDDRRPAPRPRRDDDYRERRPRPQDYYSDHREDRPPRRRDPRRDPRGDRARYEDKRYDDYDRRDPRDSRVDPRDKRKSGKGDDWQKTASTALMTYAMPMIKKEGTKWAKKELQKYLASRGGGAH